MTMLYPKSREEWLELRRAHVSSTESAALFGLSPYLTPYELAVIKKDPTFDDISESERMTWGKRLQRAIAEGIAEEEGVKIRAVSGYASLGNISMGASFDFEIIGVRELWDGPMTPLQGFYKQHGPGVLEIKNVDAFVFKNEWTQIETALEAPAHIEIQLQHQLHCIDRQWGALGVLVGGNRQILIVRMRDAEVTQAIAVKVERFWKGLTAGHMPPVTLPQDAEIIKRLYGYATPGKVLDKQGAPPDDTLHALAAAHAEATAAKSAAEKQHKSTGAALLMALGDAERVLFDDMTVSAGMVAPAKIEAHERAGYRNLRVYPKKEKST